MQRQQPQVLGGCVSMYPYVSPDNAEKVED